MIGYGCGRRGEGEYDGCGRRGEGAVTATRDGQLVGYCLRGRGMSSCVCVALFAEPYSPKSADRCIAAILPTASLVSGSVCEKLVQPSSSMVDLVDGFFVAST